MNNSERGQKFPASDSIQTCSRCNKQYQIQHIDAGVPNRDDEYVWCPECGSHQGYVRTSGYVSTKKFE